MLKSWDQPEVSIPGADQKERRLWERECALMRRKANSSSNQIGQSKEATVKHGLVFGYVTLSVSFFVASRAVPLEV